MINLEALLEEYEKSIVEKVFTENLPKKDEWRVKAESRYKNAKAALISYINK